MFHTARHSWQKTFLCHALKILIHQHMASILDSMAKKILPSQLERAIGRNFAGSDTLSLLAIRVTEAHCQDRRMTPVFQTVSKMLKGILWRHLHRFQILLNDKLSRLANFAFSRIALVHDEKLSRSHLLNWILRSQKSLHRAVRGNLYSRIRDGRENSSI